jgi:hypothetical protein
VSGRVGGYYLVHELRVAPCFKSKSENMCKHARCAAFATASTI